MIGIAHILRVPLILLGLAFFLFGMWDLLVPRAQFVKSTPPAGASIGDPPASVTINFSNKLAPESSIDVTSTVKLLPSGEKEYLAGKSLVLKSEIDRADPTGKSIRADLQADLHKGLYWVNWRTTTAGWRTVSYGKTPFGVGMTVPDHITRDMDGPIWERHYQYRSRRAALIGGVLMIALGLFVQMNKQQRTK